MWVLNYEKPSIQIEPLYQLPWLGKKSWAHSARTFVILQVFTGLESDTVLNARDAAIQKTTTVPDLL